ncbi:hypothetical protein [Aeriscardovia aeriphila]|uniref:hypothetical protein n=1 Tax=Aeriscardovia aeriphila TaxID=218139 RepID=UPI0011D1564B|nr:hypothetical protein [Aeriscardovia aeriphila]NYI26300.1 hypothetical protein [Aeriscardovia aeriphila]
MEKQKKIAGNSVIKWISGTFESGKTFTMFFAKSKKRRVEPQMAPLPHAQHEERPPTSSNTSSYEEQVASLAPVAKRFHTRESQHLQACNRRICRRQPARKRLSHSFSDWPILTISRN